RTCSECSPRRPECSRASRLPRAERLPVRGGAPLQHRPELPRRLRQQLAGAPVADHAVPADRLELVELALAVPIPDPAGVFVEPAAPGRADLLARRRRRRLVELVLGEL